MIQFFGDQGLLYLSDASWMLSLSRSTLYKYIRDGKIPYYRIGGRIRFNRDELISWMELHKVEVRK